MPDEVIENAVKSLRSNLRGELRFDEHVRPIRIVIAPDGRLIAPVMVAALRSLDTVLHLPAYQEGAIEVQVTLHPLKDQGEGGALTDRWRIYHGEPEDTSWAAMTIDAGRFGEHVIDGEALMQRNLLEADEARLCRMMNQAGTEALQRLALARGHVEVESPVVVGVDQYGVDVRRQFDIARVPSPQTMHDAAEAEHVLGAMLGDA
jgi:hypothetical protein